MKSVWLGDENGSARVRSMSLPYRHIDKPMDPEIFRRQARGENVGRPRLLPSLGLRTLRSGDARTFIDGTAGERTLSLIVSGQVEISGRDRTHALLGRGDVFLDEGLGERSGQIALRGDCRILILEAPASWQPEASGSEKVADVGNNAINLKRMYKGHDDRSHFRNFGSLFPQPNGGLSERLPIVGFHFVSFPSGYFIDWHPEGVNNLVFVSTGGLELEVGGDGRGIETFGPGDVCLAEDRTGEGHIDRVHGHCRLALIVIEDQHLW